jgi:hypothetical protein
VARHARPYKQRHRCMSHGQQTTVVSAARDAISAPSGIPRNVPYASVQRDDDASTSTALGSYAAACCASTHDEPSTPTAFESRRAGVNGGVGCSQPTPPGRHALADSRSMICPTARSSLPA